jgi:diaminopimelate decarboxylase
LDTIADDALSVRNGRLFIEDRDVCELADRFGTPLYVSSERKLRANVRRFRSAFEAAWPHGPVDVLASFKASQVLALRAILTEEGAGCDCFGSGELHGAIEGGVPAALVSVNGSFKDEATLRRGLKYGARITLDAAYELDAVERIAAELGVVASVRIRLRPAFAGIAEHSDLRDEFPIGMALHIGKYGVVPEEVVAVGRRAIDSPHLSLTGFHFHGGRHSLDPRVWRQIGHGVADAVAAACAALDGYEPQEIDCGGGFPSPRDAVRRALAAERDRPVPPPVEAFADALGGGLSRGLDEHGVARDGVRLQVEPGRGLYADTGIHVARVLAVKRTSSLAAWSWIGTDTSVINLHDIPYLSGRFEHVVANRAGEPATERSDIVGWTCMVDRITPEALVQPSVAAGDVIAFLGTGAYQECSAANFNALPRPASVLVHGTEAELVRRRETPADVFARDLVPERLRPAVAGPVR